MSILKAHIYFKGRVQGVGFRYMTQRFAKNLGLVGWVKNLPDGRVEILAQGEKNKIQNLLDELNNHFKGHIQDCQADMHEGLDSYKNFEIVG